MEHIDQSYLSDIETAFHRLLGMEQALRGIASSDYFRDFSDMFGMFARECQVISELLERDRHKAHEEKLFMEDE